MPGQPPSPPTPQSPSTVTTPPVDTSFDDRIRVTTTQLAANLESVLGTHLDEAVLEAYLVELDRRGYVEWVTITHTGDYVWDFSATPETVADAIAAVLIDRVRSWL